jgi:hypothetical protein
VSAFCRGAKTLEKLFCREQSQKMNPHSADSIGRYLDNAIFIILGIAMIIVGLYRILQKVRSGEYDEAKGKSQSKRAWIVGCLLIGFGISKFFF